MAKTPKITIKIDAKGTPALKGQTKAVKDQTKAINRQDKANKRANKGRKDTNQRMEKGVIGVANQTKSFSKMSQTMDGGGGAGGLVRAYALLAANVFALSMAFGVLSRSAQVDTLTESMKRLEEVGGQSVRAIAQGLQDASGGGLDFAEAMRATSLALSAGFDSTAITELGEVARNAAVSLGRPMGDALDRIFRGVIKVEPELLDEIGLFVRVREASAKYASTLGIAASELTEMQKRQAFANEAIGQGQEKFAAFGDIDTDQFSQLAASFSDIAQSALSLMNWAIKPLIDLLVGSKELMVGLFVGIAGFLISKAIPAMGMFTQTINQQANDAVKRHGEYLEGLKESSAASKASRLDHLKGEEKIKKVELEKMKRSKKMSKDYKGQRTQSAELKKVNIEYAKAKTHEQKIIALGNKRKVLNKSIRAGTKGAIEEAQAGLDREVRKRKEILALRKQSVAVGKQEFVGPVAGKPAANEAQRLAATAAQTTAMATIAGTASTQGFGKALGSLSGAFDDFQYDMGKAGKNVGSFGKGMFYLKGAGKAATVSMQGLMATMMPWITALMIAIPLLTWILKKMGMWNASHKAYQDAQEKTNLVLDNYTQKLRHQKKAQEEAGAGTGKFREANTAMQLTLSETTGAILAEIEAWREFLETGEEVAIKWEKFKQKMWAETSEEKGVRALQGFIDVMDELSAKTRGMLAPEVLDIATKQQEVSYWEAEANKLQEYLDLNKEIKTSGVHKGRLFMPEGESITFMGKEYKKYHDLMLATNAVKKRVAHINTAVEEQRKGAANLEQVDNKIIMAQNTKLHDQTLLEASAQKNLNSVMKGAKETVRTYMDQFITKTDVDKPMATFAQLTASVYNTIKDMELSEEVRASTLDEINNTEHEINILMSTANRTLYKMAKTDEERMAILEKQEQEYRKHQTILIKNKAEMADIAAFSKQISKLTKEAGEFMGLKLQMDSQVLDMKLQEKKLETDRALDVKNMSRFTLEILNDEKLLLFAYQDRAEALDIMKLSEKEVADLNRHITIEKAQQLDLDIAIATTTEKTAKAILDVLKKRVTASKKLNDERLKGIKLDMQMANFAKKGTTKLSSTEELKFMIKAEEVRLELAEKRAKIEKAIARVQMAILITTMRMLAPRIEVYNDKIKQLNDSNANKLNLQPIDTVQLETDLLGAAEVLVDTIDEGLSNSAKSFVVSLMNQLEKMKSKGGTDLISPLRGTSMQSLERMRGTRLDRDVAARGQVTEQGKMDTAVSGARAIKDKRKDGWLLPEEIDQLKTLQKAYYDAKTAKEAWKNIEGAAETQLFTNAIRDFSAAVASLGEEGMLAATMADFSANLIETFEAVDWKTAETADKLAVVAGIIQGIGAIMAASSAARVAGIDREIEAEKKRDGKSKQSLAKIKAMEAKKQAMEKKAFAQKKKMMIASAVMSTAAAMAGILGKEASTAGMGAIILAAIVGAMGLAQVAIISKMQYQGGGGASDISMPSAVNIGERGNKVDVSKQASAGELSFLRGARGIGTSATSFTPTGGAAGLRKGYATGGEILVGERGPETITPLTGMNVIPNQGMKNVVNANFTIHAIDAAGVEDVLLNQQGNIIGMIRSAANDHGEEFLEAINTDMYGEPKSAGGVDY